MKLSLSFGDIFKYKGEIFVYLTEAETGKYVARILATDVTKMLEDRQEKLTMVGSRIPIDQQIIFSYTILETPQYEGRACFHAAGAKEHEGFELYVDDLKTCLSDNDKKNLRDDILEKPLNGELKNEIGKIKL